MLSKVAGDFAKLDKRVRLVLNDMACSAGGIVKALGEVAEGCRAMRKKLDRYRAHVIEESQEVGEQSIDSSSNSL